MTDSAISVRVDELERRTDTSTRVRVRNVLGGGRMALRELLGEKKAEAIGLDMPAANFLYSGMERLAQKLRHPPTLKVDPIGRNRNDDVARERADRLEAIVRGHDHAVPDRSPDAKVGDLTVRFQFKELSLGNGEHPRCVMSINDERFFGIGRGCHRMCS